MNRTQLTRELGELSGTQGTEMQALVTRLTAEARESAKAAIALWQAGTPETFEAVRANPGLSDKAAALLVELNDLATIPLLDAPDPSGVVERVWVLRGAVGAQLEVRERILARLDRMLDDRTPFPPRQNAGPIEEPEPERRACDEAYVLMREFISFGESELTQLMNIEAFLHLPEEERDEEIRKAKGTRTWTQLVENVEEEGF